MRRIYADFNNQAEDGRILLNCSGSMSDISKIEPSLQEGERVVLYVMEGDFEVQGTVHFDQIWWATIDDSTIVYLDEKG